MRDGSRDKDPSLPSASIVVPVLNGAATLGDMLNALRQQTPTPNDLEIIVVDNGSSDGTRAIADRFPVILLEERKRGPAAARNRGLSRARGEVVVHLDADTLPTRRWLAEILAPFCDPRTVLVAGRSLSFPPKTPAERYLSRFQLYDAEKNINRAVLPFAASMNMAVRRRAANAIGGWCEAMMTSEDVDFCTRLLRHYPRPIVYARRAVLFHRNRNDDHGLQRQAWTYGEGVADTYRRYPQQLSWGPAQYGRLAWNLAARKLRPPCLRFARRLGFATSEDVEYAHYHWMWTWFFWRGFFSFRSSGLRREPWA
jgi:glycosyltransferase involved in cell wall biosynthesis